MPGGRARRLDSTRKTKNDVLVSRRREIPEELCIHRSLHRKAIPIPHLNLALDPYVKVSVLPFAPAERCFPTPHASSWFDRPERDAFACWFVKEKIAQ